MCAPRFRCKECNILNGSFLQGKHAARTVNVFGLRCWILTRSACYGNKVHCVHSSSNSKIVIFKWHRDCTVYWAEYWISSVNRTFQPKLSRLFNSGQQPWECGESICCRAWTDTDKNRIQISRLWARIICSVFTACPDFKLVLQRIVGPSCLLPYLQD